MRTYKNKLLLLFSVFLFSLVFHFSIESLNTVNLSDKTATDNQTVHVTVSSQQPSRKRWLLSPTDGKETLYSVTLVSDNELSFQRSSTKPNTEGTSKPESFYRVK